uniref:Uncharacterized protein n=1 Tax=Rhizophora mucronata TaxID=61149 RepID=A0A2P2IVF0_RHIMU
MNYDHRMPRHTAEQNSNHLRAKLSVKR